MSGNHSPEGYVIHEGYPSVDDYLHLRATSGLRPTTTAQAATVAKGSWYGCYAVAADNPRRAVAMGRVIGDGGWYFLIADMATIPDHQRRGLGDAILNRLLTKIKAEAAPGEAYVTLMADEPGRKLYQKHGFAESMPKEMGMVLVIDKDATGGT